MLCWARLSPFITEFLKGPFEINSKIGLVNTLEIPSLVPVLLPTQRQKEIATRDPYRGLCENKIQSGNRCRLESVDQHRPWLGNLIRFGFECVRLVQGIVRTHIG